MIARAAKADRGVVMSNNTSAVACTFHTIAGVVRWGHLANPLLHRVSRIADADMPGGTKCAAPNTTVDIFACIIGGNAILPNAMEALVTYTQGLI